MRCMIRARTTTNCSPARSWYRYLHRSLFVITAGYLLKLKLLLPVGCATVLPILVFLGRFVLYLSANTYQIRHVTLRP